MARQNNSRTDRVRAGYDAGAAGYDERFAGNARNAKRFARIEACQLEIAHRASDVLVLGCGTGRLLAQIQGPPCVVGVDLSHAMLSRARARGLAVAQGDAHALPFADGSFDAVCATNAVFRYLDYAAAFGECARVLRPGGHLAVHQYAALTWSLSGLVRGTREESMHVRDPDQLRAPAQAAGFSERALYLWRSVRFAPYAVRIPPSLPGRWWRHMTLVLQRR